MTVFQGKGRVIEITLQAFGLSCPILHISWRMCGFSGDWFPVFPMAIVDTLYCMDIMATVIMVTSLYPIYIIMCSACWYVSPSVCKSVGTFDCWYVGKLVRW